MAQHDGNIANGSGSTVRADVNAAIQACLSNSSGATAPSPTLAYQFWADTTSGLLKIRNAANSAWVDMGVMASTNLGLLPLTGGTLTGVLNTAQGSDIASASTINLDTATGNIVDVTGTTTITAVTLSQGRFRIVRFTGALTLTHGSSLVLPTAANITTAAGDYAIFAGYASSVVRCVGYFRASGQPLAGAAVQIQKQIYPSSGSFTFTTPSNITTSTVFKIIGTGAGGSGANYNGGNGCGGSSGATFVAYVSGLSPSTAYSGSVGAGGASVSTNNTAGNAGGNTSITIGGTTYTANGGPGGTNSATPSVNATASNGDFNISGTAPAGGSTANTASSGAPSYWGGGGRGNASGAGEAGGAPGAGGGVAGGSSSASGAGANGIVVIEWNA